MRLFSVVRRIVGGCSAVTVVARSSRWDAGSRSRRVVCIGRAAVGGGGRLHAWRVASRHFGGDSPPWGSRAGVFIVVASDVGLRCSSVVNVDDPTFRQRVCRGRVKRA
jgi:hypothetical protein